MMLPPDEFRAAFSDSELEAELPERPITTLRDVQYLYGKLYTLATSGGGRFGVFLTPDAASDYIDEPESLVILRFDLSQETPRLGDPPVRVTRYSEEHVDKVAHSKYSSGRGFDHSITHQGGKDSSPQTIADWAGRMLKGWLQEDPIQAVAESHDDGWVLEKLANLGSDEGARESVKEAVERELEGSRTVVITVEVRLEADAPYRFPGELDVFQEATRARFLSKLVAKGSASDSQGNATCLLTGELVRTVGTAQDPMMYFLGKQFEKFPGLDPERSWQSHPISEDAAVILPNAEPFISACAYTSFGATIYYLPYFQGRATPERALALYSVLYEMVEDREGGHATPVERVYDELQREDYSSYEMRFYVGAVLKHQKLRWDVVGETLNGGMNYAVELKSAHAETLEALAEVGAGVEPPRSGVLPEPEKGRLLNRRSEPDALLQAIATGGYFSETFPRIEGEGGPREDDARIHALVSVLSGAPMDAQHLIRQYAERLVQDEGERFPSYRVACQYAQLVALARAGLLASDDDVTTRVAEPNSRTEGDTMKGNATDGGNQKGRAAEARAEKLERFLETNRALQEDSERRGSFLLGALVGHVTGYQRSQNVSLTAVDQHPIKGLSKTNIKRRAREVLDKDIVYSRDRGMGSTMYREVVDRLRDTFLEADPETWELTLDDLRFYYALGVTYGMNDASAYRAQDEAKAVETVAT